MTAIPPAAAADLLAAGKLRPGPAPMRDAGEQPVQKVIVSLDRMNEKQLRAIMAAKDENDKPRLPRPIRRAALRELRRRGIEPNEN